MEHEVHVPVPPARLRAALTDPARIARAVPGLQQDAGTEPVAGRLKVRVGSHSITYRGALRVSVQDDGSYAMEGDATETRGTGSVKLALSLRVREAGDGSAVTFDGTATADGRITELAPDAVRSATTRLLDRFAENLGADVEEQPEQPELPVPAPEFGPAEADGPDAIEAPDTIEARDDIEAADDIDDPDDPDDPDDIDGIPEIADTVAGIGDIGGLDDPHVSENFGDSPVPPAEAAHARRTMIGRSAEEVDHAPPRGRYAPVPAPQSVSSSATLRWAAPAAALVVASAIVVNRVLRKRR
ncbi:SRPBCC domain-containing protein [Streptomyces sp. NBC_01239]|uniref:SRPBCC family protein n=1 Tax=Streptomyces sp. NBC_01239 TaxID=2903792 RepID=UPI00225B5A0F|nr:SRPBCC domain-containing protein [Streptomyces sp. NBC_01239]MCX4812078.1 SRPBCC domain-containing protein [Streptomyces sp. NBC_01239]